jgi:hypothetical protein
MERTIDFIRVWFWDRTDTSVPNDVKNGTSSVNTDDWVRNIPSCTVAPSVSAEFGSQGTPSADFPNINCDFSKYFGQNYISIGLDFCSYY